MRKPALLVAAVTLVPFAAAHGASPIYGGRADMISNTPDTSPYFPSGFPRQQSVGNRGMAVGVIPLKASNNLAYNRAFRLDPVGGEVTLLQELAPTTAGQSNHIPFGISAAGTVIGSATIVPPIGSFTQVPVRWDAGGSTATRLGNLGDHPAFGPNGLATDINEAGTIVGRSMKTVNDRWLSWRAVRWNAGSTVPTPLDSVFTHPDGVPAESLAFAVNLSGAVVGTSVPYSATDAYLGSRAVRWDADGTTGVVLGDLGTDAAGNTLVAPLDIGATGVAVGHARKYSASGVNLGDRAVRWDAGQTEAVELANLGVDSSGSARSFAYEVNATGTIIGDSLKYNANGQGLGRRAVRWAADGSLTELGLLGQNSASNANSEASAINDAGFAVGCVGAFTAGTHYEQAVAWGPSGTAQNLKSFLPANSGWTQLYKATDISNTGWISGYGFYDADGAGGRAGYIRMFVMLVPQAGTYGRGDADFDTDVDFDDLLILAKNFNKPSNGSTATADFDLNGTTNFDDLLALARNFNAAAASVATATFDAAFATDWALAQSLVPEPSSAMLAGMGWLGCCRRRR